MPQNQSPEVRALAAGASTGTVAGAGAKPRRKAPSKPRAPRAAKPPVRLKIVWAVGDPGVATTTTFPYAERAAANAECARRGKNCRVKAIKVPME